MFNRDRSPQFYLKIPLLLRLMLWDDYKYDIRLGNYCLIIIDFLRFELHLGISDKG